MNNEQVTDRDLVMPSFNRSFPSKFLQSADLEDGSIIATISKIECMVTSSYLLHNLKTGSKEYPVAGVRPLSSSVIGVSLAERIGPGANAR